MSRTSGNGLSRTPSFVNDSVAMKSGWSPTPRTALPVGRRTRAISRRHGIGKVVDRVGGHHAVKTAARQGHPIHRSLAQLQLALRDRPAERRRPVSIDVGEKSIPTTDPFGPTRSSMSCSAACCRAQAPGRTADCSASATQLNLGAGGIPFFTVAGGPGSRRVSRRALRCGRASLLADRLRSRYVDT